MKLFGNRKDTRADAPHPRTGVRKKPVGLLIAAVAGAVLIAGAAAGVLWVNGVETIFPNVTVDGIDIGGLSLRETAETLNAHGYGDLSGKTVSVKLPTDYTLTVSAEDVCTDTAVADIALMAWDACKGGSAVGNALTYLRCSLAGMALQSGAGVRVDERAVRAAVDSAAAAVRLRLLGSELDIGEENVRIVKGAQSVELDADAIAAMIAEAFETENYATLTYEAKILTGAELDLDGIYDSVHREPADAYYDPESGEIVAETVGVAFDVAEAKRLWTVAEYGETVLIPLVLTQPEITEKALSEKLFRDQLSTRTTSLAGSTSNRINNVRKATASIDGTVLMPGQEFSYNAALGERTAANGYMLAGAYSGGQTVQEYGGGICQVSSTLYYCALYANLSITARTCHMFPVGYLPAGLDATVSWGGPEFKFVNNREYPVKIIAAVDAEGRNVTVELWGTDVDGSRTEITSEVWYFYDAVWKDVRLGYKAQTYRVVYDRDGGLISRKPEALSTYRYHEEDIAWPPEAMESPAPEETEQPVETEPPEETDMPPEETEPPEETDAPPETSPPVLTETPAPEETDTPPAADTPVPTETTPATEPPDQTEPPPPATPAPDVTAAPEPTTPVGGSDEAT